MTADRPPTKYRFLPSNIPGIWAVFDRQSNTRVPGFVKMKAEAVGDAGRFVYTREIPNGKPAGRAGAKPLLHTVSAATVAELSDAIDRYFTNGETT